MSDLTALGLALVLLLGNAFFVGAEFALISSRRTQIEPRAQQGSRRARTTLRAMEQVSLMMAGAQLGITICSLGLGAVGEPAVAHLLEKPFASTGVPEGLLHPVAFAVALTIVVSLHMVIGEMVPKNIALAGPERSALLLGPPLFGIVQVLRPLIWLLNRVANLVLRAIRVEPKDEVTSAFTQEEVSGLVAESRREGLLDEE
ncbi:MAG TPA: CNNM domain-containing protein, partial [Nocardioidaceae bacterium]|nr:CNNM domain-containing protein [Nocardioidaceae bacterium]